MKLLEMEDPLKNIIVLTVERWSHSFRHKISGLEEVRRCIENPIEIRKSRHDTETGLYYRPISSEEYVCVVVQMKSEFILTAYKTNSKKKGDVIWKRK